MVVLYVLLAIIAFFVILFSVRFTIYMTYDNEFKVDVKWLFIKKSVLPKSEDEKSKKAKKEKPKKEKKKKSEEEKPTEQAEEKTKKENMLVTFYKNQGFSGVLQLINDTVSAIGGMFGSVFKHFVFRELKLFLSVGADDSAETAMLYGKTCSFVFPAMGLVTSTCKVKDYDCGVQPNFIQPEKKAYFKVVLSMRPIFITNAVIVLAFKLLFKVVIKLLSNKPTEASNEKKLSNSVKTKEINSQGGK